MNILKTVDLQKIYGQGETEVKALDGVNLEVEKWEFVAIVGAYHFPTQEYWFRISTV